MIYCASAATEGWTDWCLSAIMGPGKSGTCSGRCLADEKAKHKRRCRRGKQDMQCGKSKNHDELLHRKGALFIVFHCAASAQNNNARLSAIVIGC
jgi:hypothetical protein